jgi:predicted transposase/invertase (TIGR01784 family)
MFLTDEQTNLDSARKEGLSQGLSQGIRQGLSQGRIEIAKSALAIGLPLDQIATITGLTVDEIEKLRP